jgi:hypothetical protein
MHDESAQAISIRERALQLALKEIVAQQQYVGLVPIAPAYEIVARRAQAIEQVLAAEHYRERT